jgi:hypothetical protein
MLARHRLPQRARVRRSVRLAARLAPGARARPSDTIADAMERPEGGARSHLLMRRRAPLLADARESSIVQPTTLLRNYAELARTFEFRGPLPPPREPDP